MNFPLSDCCAFGRLTPPSDFENEKPLYGEVPVRTTPGQGRQISVSTGNLAFSLQMDHEKTSCELEGDQPMQSGPAGSSEALAAIVSSRREAHNALLILAVSKGQLEVVRELAKRLKTADSINKSGPDGYTALMIAAESGDLDIVRELVARLKTADAINKPGSGGVTALMFAAQNGHLDIVRELVTRLQTADAINKPGPGGATALMFAAQNGHLDVVRELATRLKTVKAIKMPNANGDTALLIAAKKGHTMIVQELEAIVGVFLAKELSSNMLARLRGKSQSAQAPR